MKTFSRHSEYSPSELNLFRNVILFLLPHPHFFLGLDFIFSSNPGGFFFFFRYFPVNNNWFFCGSISTLAGVFRAFLEVARKKGVICFNGLLLSECKYLQPLEQIGAGD